MHINKTCVVYNVYLIINYVKSNKKNKVFANKMKVKRADEETENEGAIKWENSFHMSPNGWESIENYLWTHSFKYSF